ncbi:MAG: hypothetical protein KatS3mg024_0970 [Armatimonadota bacterium]|nr:MAG: hypothetical protein KatS3mg024_0970 [Armatimonadota bacterium]
MDEESSGRMGTMFWVVLAGGLASLLPMSEGVIPSHAAGAAPASVSGLEALAPLIENAILEGAFPGAALVVGQGDRILFARGFGTLTGEPGSPPVTLDTVYDLASVTKVVGTSTAAMLLLEDGRLRLDDRVADFIPGFGTAGKDTVTVQDLLTHTSGLKAYETWQHVEEKRRPGEPPADALLRHYAGLPVSYPPRTRIRYSCLNMQVLARVVENAAGERMEDLLVRRVYLPLGMGNTCYTLNSRLIERSAPTLRLPDGSLLKGTVHDPLARYHGAAGHSPGNAGLFSTARDLSRFCRMILRGGELDGIRVMKPGTVHRMTSNLAPSATGETRGLGWGIYGPGPYASALNGADDSRAIGHTGYTGTFLWLDKRTKAYVVLLTNRTFPDEKDQPEGKPSFFSVREQVVKTVRAYVEGQVTP